MRAPGTRRSNKPMGKAKLWQMGAFASVETVNDPRRPAGRSALLQSIQAVLINSAKALQYLLFRVSHFVQSTLWSAIDQRHLRIFLPNCTCERRS